MLEQTNMQIVTDRIQRMEQYFDKVSSAFNVNSELIYKDATIQKMVQKLMEYMDSGQWLQDYECDERGELPADLKRGVLSQDALYNMLSRIKNEKNFLVECPFCKIIHKEANAHVIYESVNIMVFLDIDPINEGHVLIVPKLHEASIDNIPIDVLNEIMETFQKIVTALKEIYSIDGYSIMQNGGAFCDFGHGHFHIFPRYEDDGFGWKYPEGEFECSDRVAEQLRNAMS